jgi:hypothetical protein
VAKHIIILKKENFPVPWGRNMAEFQKEAVKPLRKKKEDPCGYSFSSRAERQKNLSPNSFVQRESNAQKCE